MMTKEKYQTLSLKVLRDLAKTRGLRGISTLKKDQLIERMLQADVSDAEKEKEEEQKRRENEEKKAAEEWERWAAAKARMIDKREMRKEAGRREDENRTEPEEDKEDQAKAQKESKEENKEESKVTPPEKRRETRKKERQKETVEDRKKTAEKGFREASRRGRPPKTPSEGRAGGEAGKRVTAYTGAGEKKHLTEEKPAAEPKTAPEESPAKEEKAAPEAKEEAKKGAEEEKAKGREGQTGDPKNAEKRPLRKTSRRMTEKREKPQRRPKEKAAFETAETEDRTLPDLKNHEKPSEPQGETAEEATAGLQESIAEKDGEKPAASHEETASETRTVSQDSPSAENTRKEYPTPSSPFHQDRIREARQVSGILEVMTDGYGFMRSGNFLPGEDDIYVSPSQIRRFGLKSGDKIQGQARSRGVNEKIGALLYVEKINDLPPDEARHRLPFEKMTPTFPDERVRLERADGSVATRIVDLISPIGKGQRGMIVSPPKAGKTTLLKDIAASILRRDPSAYLMILLIDERPEEVTDMKESVHGENVEILYSTFDELPEHHKRVSEMAIERAKRLVEHRRDVFILLDSITRLARAYNVLVPPSGRTLSGGLDPTALYMPKRFFGAARNMREGGSLTILATALVDTGSKMDDVIYEEFKGTGNMELILDRRLQERRIFPAIDIAKSGTRREDLLLTPTELEAVNRMRRSMNGMKADEAVEAILRTFTMTRSNDQVVNAVLSGRIG